MVAKKRAMKERDPSRSLVSEPAAAVVVPGKGIERRNRCPRRGAAISRVAEDRDPQSLLIDPGLLADDESATVF
jgi:hypothetical protein